MADADADAEPDAHAVHIVIETENVIEAVRGHRLLWDPAHDLYTGKEARRLAWNDICRTLMPDWDEYDHQDQNDIERKVQQRWRTARDCFVKARAARVGGAGAGAGATTRRDKALRSYSHFDRLAFLEETLRAPGAGGVLTLPRESRRSRRHRPRPRRPQHPTPPTVVGAAGDDDDEDGTLSTFERRLLATLARTTRRSPLEPDDEDFFRSLAPMLATLDPSQKLAFRGRVLDDLQRLYRDHVAARAVLEPYKYVSVNEHRHRHRPDDDGDDKNDTEYPPPVPAPAPAPAPATYNQ